MRTGALAAAFGFAVFVGSPAFAAEGAAGFYLLGSKGQGAGALPPEGVYFVDSAYFYSGEAIGGLSIPFGGVVGTATLGAGIAAEVTVHNLTGLWVTPYDVLGGDLALGIIVPAGDVNVDVGARLTAPAIGFTATRLAEDSFTGVGDPVLNAVVGWKEGTSAWSLSTLVNIPEGDYDPGQLANLAFNHWAVDVTGAYTWLDPAIGWDLSVAAGFTFNWENSATNYETGDEFHLELAATYYISPFLQIGVAGYHYQQISGDSGPGAVLGDFEGRVSAIGPTATATIPIGNTAVTTTFKWLEEFDVKNRLEGRSAFVNVTIPLGGVPQSQ